MDHYDFHYVQVVLSERISLYTDTILVVSILQASHTHETLKIYVNVYHECLIGKIHASHLGSL